LAIGSRFIGIIGIEAVTSPVVIIAVFISAVGLLTKSVNPEVMAITLDFLSTKDQKKSNSRFGRSATTLD
jgi:hypothetical protein